MGYGKTQEENGMLPTNLTFAAAIAAFATTTVAPVIQSRYGEPWRHYHDELHIAEIKGHLQAAEADGVRIHDGAAAIAFVLWHDSIYDPQAVHGRNEALSSQLCSLEFGAIGHPTSVARACEAILATIGHTPPDPATCPDSALLLDCDLAILGAPPERFALYDIAIRQEYAHVPEDVYRTKRREVLLRFLQRERLFMTDWAHARWDAQARINLAQATA